MKTDASKLSNFLKKATLDGSIMTALLKLEKNELNVWVRTADNTVAVNAVMKNVVAEEQVWPIKDTVLLLKSLELFSGVIELQKDKNKLSIFNADRQVDITLAEEAFVENKLEKYPGVQYEATRTISSAIFKNTLKNKSIVKTNLSTLVADGKLLQVISGDSKFDTIVEKIPSDMPEAKTHLSDCANAVFDNLDDKVEIGLKTDYPVLFKFESPDYKIQYVVAQIVQEATE